MIKPNGIKCNHSYISWALAGKYVFLKYNFKLSNFIGFLCKYFTTMT